MQKINIKLVNHTGHPIQRGGICHRAAAGPATSFRIGPLGDQEAEAIRVGPTGRGGDHWSLWWQEAPSLGGGYQTWSGRSEVPMGVDTGAISMRGCTGNQALAVWFRFGVRVDRRPIPCVDRSGEMKVVSRYGYDFKGVRNSFFVLDEVWQGRAYDLPNFELEAGMTVVDIGAHQGFFSVLAASRGARVFAFEPHPRSFRILGWNLASSGSSDRVEAHRCAITRRDGSADLFVPDTGSPGLSSATVSTSRRSVEELRSVFYQRYRTEQVASMTLATAWRRLGIGRCDLLKLDCEGAEHEILTETPNEVLDRVSRIVLETHRGYCEKELVEEVSGRGFEILSFVPRSAGSGINGWIKAARSPAGEAAVPAGSTAL